MEKVASRSFAPLLLVAGMVALVPGLGDIPGVTTTMAVLVLLVSGQILFRRKQLWLPRWLLNLSVARDKFCKALDWLRRPARFMVRIVRPRLAIFAEDTAIASGCVVVAFVMPFMEVVPFGAIAAGVALTAFSVGLIARDGLVALLAFMSTALTIRLGAYLLL
jgi:hypothetical protein